MDPRPRQTVGAEGSMPVPASVPKVDQPKVTINVNPNPPQKEGFDPESLVNDPATHESSPSQPNTVQSNGDPKDNSPQQNNDSGQGHSYSGDSEHGANPKPESDPKGDSGPNQGNGHSGDSGHGADPKPNSDAKDNHSQQGSDNDGDPGLEAQSKPLAYPVVKPIVTNIAGQAISAAPDAVAIAGDTLNPGDPGATLDGTTISLDTAGQLIVGSKTISLAQKPPQTITTSVAGQAITAAPNAIIVAGTTLSPMDPGITLDGTLISLNTASQLVIGSKTIPLDSA